MHRLLLADDDRDLCNMLSDFLLGEGFQCECAYDGESALARVLAEEFDALVLDVMMPGINGFEVLRRLREQRPIPVLMLTARGEETDSIIGLEIGADDYLAKPCSPKVLAARLRAVLRRAEGNRERPVAVEGIEVAGVTLHPGARHAAVDGRELELTSAEFNMLELLIRDAGQVVSKEVLSEKGLGRRLMPYDRSVDMHISNLRKKLGGEGSQRIRTVRGSGYLFALPY
ncbi:response regulator [Endothiovibrio diazotrophicus]